MINSLDLAVDAARESGRDLRFDIVLFPNIIFKITNTSMILFCVSNVY